MNRCFGCSTIRPTWRCSGRDVSDERLISLPLRNDPMVAFVSRNHPWADRESICLADLDDTPLVLREIGSVTRQTLEEEMARRRVSHSPGDSGRRPGSGA